MAPEEGLELLGEQPAVDLLGHVSRQEVHPGAPVVEVLQSEVITFMIYVRFLGFFLIPPALSSCEKSPPIIQIFLHDKMKPLSNFMADFENSRISCQLMSKIHDDIERWTNEKVH